MIRLADAYQAYLIQNQASLTMIALKDIKAGEQIYNDFGELPRSDLLRRYGYVTDRYKKWDVVEISLALVEEVARMRKPMSEVDLDKRVSVVLAVINHYHH